MQENTRKQARLELVQAASVDITLAISCDTVPLLASVGRTGASMAPPAESVLAEHSEAVFRALERAAAEAGMVYPAAYAGRAFNDTAATWRGPTLSGYTAMTHAAVGLRRHIVRTLVFFPVASVVNRFAEAIADQFPTLALMLVDTLNPENDIPLAERIGGKG